MFFLRKFEEVEGHDLMVDIPYLERMFLSWIHTTRDRRAADDDFFLFYRWRVSLTFFF